MLFFTLFCIAIGLSMDAFAVSISNAVSIRNFTKKQACLQALYFGGFQMLMPLLGWYLGNGVGSYVESFGHWIAFILLAIIGGNMIVSAHSNKETKETIHLTHKTLLLQAIATSIDALAVGIGLGILHINIFVACSLIGCTTFVCSLAGAKVGSLLGDALEEKAELLGGVILIAIGVKLLLEHTIFA